MGERRSHAVLGIRLYTENLRTARQADEFRTGGEVATFEPRFTVHGFRFAEISGYPGELSASDITARVAHSDIPAAGTFACSQEWLACARVPAVRVRL
jgi:alpha-L-rhamnosidase